MALDITSQFNICLNYPLEVRINELTRIIDQSSPIKDLQILFPQLINSIFSSTFNNIWGIRTVTYDLNRYEFEALLSFLEPQGPMFRLCYKLLSDPQLKYNLSLNVLPLDLQMSLERGRCPQFYADMLTTDPQTFNVVGLSLNPFDYYIFNFALHLININQNKTSWENWNSVYFTLACDYLMHFLPSDPNVPVLPHIPNYTGKVLMAAPLQTANRPLHSSLLSIPDLSGSGITNQHTSQTQSRHEVWRSETVLQVFIDIWMSVEQFNPRNIDMYQRNYSDVCSSPEQVRTVRVLVKHLHTFSSKHLSDPTDRSSALRNYARKILRPRAYIYIKYLVTTWPLDASFRLVMELWLSLIQPWRYIQHHINQERFLTYNNNQEEHNTNTLDASFIQFIAENFPSYTCIFQLVLPRFMRSDITTYKNAVMLFRLGKVFSQQDLVPILWKLEQAITCYEGPGVFHHTMDTSNDSALDLSYTHTGGALHKWVAIAKQAISELNMSTNLEYEPVWSDTMRQFAIQFVNKIIAAKFTAEKNYEDYNRRLKLKHQGAWATVKHWLMMDGNDEEITLEELKKVPTCLNAAVHHFSNIFRLNENALQTSEIELEENSLDQSSFIDHTNFPLFITNKLRAKHTEPRYMGDPDLMPISSYENTILVRMLYQISSRLNEMYEEHFSNLWTRSDLWGYVAREILQGPCTIQSYMKDAASHQLLVRRELRARLSLRRLGSHAAVVWLAAGYLLSKLFSCSGLIYIFVIFIMWMSFVFIKASLKKLRIVK